MDLKKKLYLIIDAGGTYFKSALLNAHGEIKEGSVFKIRSWSEGPAEQIINAYRETVSHGLEYIKERSADLGGIGIATPGPFDYEKGIPLMRHKFAFIYGLNLSDLIHNMPGVQPDIPICFMHDANATLAGELWKGNAQGYNNVALVTLGTGLGFAFSQNGKIQYNSQGGPAISIYKLPYKNGILEDYISKRGILKIYGDLSNKKFIKVIEVSDIGKWANEGDKACLDTFKEAGKILSEALYSILYEWQIQCFLFGGQISRSYHLMERSFKSGLQGISSLKKISVVNNFNNSAFWGVLWDLIYKIKD
jgi:glucokinase